MKKFISIILLMLVFLAPAVLHADVIYQTGLNLAVPYQGNDYLGWSVIENTYQYASWWTELRWGSYNSDFILRGGAWNGGALDVIAGKSGYFNIATTPGSYIVNKYTAGTVIGPGSAQAWNWGYLNNSFVIGQERYLAFDRYNSGSGLYTYGWIDISRDSDQQYTIHGWAWDTTPGETIRAGSIIGGGNGGSLGGAPEAAAVPEPSTWAMWLFGAVIIGGAAYRKHFARS